MLTASSSPNDFRIVSKSTRVRHARRRSKSSRVFGSLIFDLLCGEPAGPLARQRNLKPRRHVRTNGDQGLLAKIGRQPSEDKTHMAQDRLPSKLPSTGEAQLQRQRTRRTESRTLDPEA